MQDRVLVRETGEGERKGVVGRLGCVNLKAGIQSGCAELSTVMLVEPRSGQKRHILHRSFSLLLSERDDFLMLGWTQEESQKIVLACSRNRPEKIQKIRIQ